MPKYTYVQMEAIRAELWYHPSRKALLLEALMDAGEPGETLSWERFKPLMAACIHGMYGSNKVSNPNLYTVAVLEENKSFWDALHNALHGEAARKADLDADEKKKAEMIKQEPAGGILADGSPASAQLARELLGLGPNNAKQAVQLPSVSGDVRPTFLLGRRTRHATYDDYDGQGKKDDKHSGKSKITFFYDLCPDGVRSVYYLVGWGVHTGMVTYQLVAMVPPTGGPLDKNRQWGHKQRLDCGTETVPKKK